MLVADNGTRKRAARHRDSSETANFTLVSFISVSRPLYVHPTFPHSAFHRQTPRAYPYGGAREPPTWQSCEYPVCASCRAHPKALRERRRTPCVHPCRTPSLHHSPNPAVAIPHRAHSSPVHLRSERNATTARRENPSRRTRPLNQYSTSSSSRATANILLLLLLLLPVLSGPSFGVPNKMGYTRRDEKPQCRR